MSRKFVSDALVIARLDWLRYKRSAVWTVVLLFFPLATLFFARYLIPPGVPLGARLIAGSVVYNMGIAIVQAVSNDLIFVRFFHRLKLIQVAPVHPVSYALGSLILPVARATLASCVILGFAPLFGIDIHLSAWFIPVAMLTALSLAGVAFVIATWAPSQEVGNMAGVTVGILIVIVSPLYFPLSRLPDWAAAVARLSPYTYAADALDAILSNRGGFYDEVGILLAITAATMSFGLAGMRWREA